MISWPPGFASRTNLSASTARARRSAHQSNRALAALAAEHIDIPIVIGGEDIRTDATRTAVMPHNHRHVLATWHQATPKLVSRAVEAAARAHKDWSAWPLEERAAVFLRAADLLATSWRDVLNGATMLGQSKTVFQAEIDSACEIIDFWRFNVQFACELAGEQPISDPGVRNSTDYRPLEGFVYALTPLNFTSIAANLPTAPAIMGNTVIWKPASSAMFSAHYVMQLLEAAGVPPGVINFVPGDPEMISEVVLSHRDLAGVHFTGSTHVFNHIWRTIGSNVDRYRSYPRVVGETGGKDFVIAHASADVEALVAAIVRAATSTRGRNAQR